jgi:hypothetical protein
MSKHAVAGSLPPSVASEQLRRVQAKFGEVMSVSTIEGESPNRTRGLGRANMPGLVELEFATTESRPVLMQTPAERPVWVNGTLPGMMAGKRPAPWPTRSL